MVKSRVRFPEHEREEMLAEGIALLYELAERYAPSREKKSAKPGHVCRGPRCCQPSFAGYASFLLPKRMQSAWKALHPEHSTKKDPDGKRHTIYGEAPVTLGHHLDGFGMHTGAVSRGVALVATQVVNEEHGPILEGWQAPPVVASAMVHMPAQERILAPAVARMIDEGRRPVEIAETLNLRRGEVTKTWNALASAVAYQQTITEAAA